MDDLNGVFEFKDAIRAVTEILNGLRDTQKATPTDSEVFDTLQIQCEILEDALYDLTHENAMLALLASADVREDAE